MHDITARAATPGSTRSPNFLKHQRWYPTIDDLRRGARSGCRIRLRIWRRRRRRRHRHQAQLGGARRLEMVPRYGVMPKLPPVNVELFGRKYSAPLGVAPMGSPIVVWPGADKLLAKAAQRARVPYTLGVAGGATIEEIAKIAPDVMWLQLYRFAKNDHAIGFDLIRRADAAGVHVLMLTLDVPVRTVRPREVKVGMGGGGIFRPDLRMVAGMVKWPGWAFAFLQNTLPRFANIQPYAGPARAERNYPVRPQGDGRRVFLGRGEALSRPLEEADVVKGILHPEDAEKAVSIGIDGFSYPITAAADRLAAGPNRLVPAIVKAAGAGPRSVRPRGPQRHRRGARPGARCLGRAGRQGVPLGPRGARRRGAGSCIDLLIDELQSALGQLGAQSPGRGAKRMVRHPGELHF